MGEVTTTTLEAMCELIVDCPHFTPQWTSGGYIVIRNQNIRNGRLDLSQPSFTHERDYLRRIKRAKPRAGDIIFTREAPMGEVCVIPEGLECCVGQRQVLLRPKEEIDGKFLFYALRSEFVRHQVSWNEGTGSTVSNVRIPVLKALNIPRFPEQEKELAAVLSALDDKIELNQRMNATLERQARALFADWFTHFGPTRAKMEGRPPYLAPEIWSLFPDRLDENGLPEGWEMGTLADIAQSPRRGVKPAEVGKDTPYIGLEHMPRRSIALSDWDGAGKVSSNKSRFRKGEFLFGKLRPYFHKVGVAAVDGICSTDIVVVTPIAEEWAALTLACISSDDFVEYTNAGSTGTKMPRTSWKIMAAYELCIPSREVAQAYQEIVWPMIEKIIDNIHQSRTLAQTRDLLLPKLMSGEIRVAEAAKIMEEAL